jgi:hypothetical protein
VGRGINLKRFTAVPPSTKIEIMSHAAWIWKIGISSKRITRQSDKQPSNQNVLCSVEAWIEASPGTSRNFMSDSESVSKLLPHRSSFPLMNSTRHTT